ncbi:hypothetical protein ACWD5R_27505 [Streptomyces sp. NPDC002514]|uniref:hypothetical protein n=1 Tax=unclassified Streptomyces TaxID=2593676 RepID=UPI0036853B7F
MPTPYGSRGGMAFGAEELRVLRRALALALHPGPASAEDVQDCLRLAESLDEAMREAARLRAFLVADLARYRAALPGTVVGYLALLDEALAAGHRPTADDLAALRALRGNPAAAALLDRCTRGTGVAVPSVPASRRSTRLMALPGGAGEEKGGNGEQGEKPRERPAERPEERPRPAPRKPSRPIPTPGEVFPRRKPPTPPANAGPPRQRLAAG